MATRTLNEVAKSEEVAALPNEEKRPLEAVQHLPPMGFISRGLLFARVFAFAGVVHPLMRLNIAQVARIVEPGENVRPPRDDRSKRIVKYVEIAIRRGAPAVRPGCLTRGLTRYYFLRRAGMDVTLCFGMGRRNGAFVGHCWLVKDGEPYLENEDPRLWYVEMHRISRTSAGTSAAAAASELMRFG